MILTNICMHLISMLGKVSMCSLVSDEGIANVWMIGILRAHSFRDPMGGLIVKKVAEKFVV